MAGRSTQSRTDFDDKGLLFLNSQCLRAMGSQLVFTAMTKSSIICISVSASIYSYDKVKYYLHQCSLSLIIAKWL